MGVGGHGGVLTKFGGCWGASREFLPEKVSLKLRPIKFSGKGKEEVRIRMSETGRIAFVKVLSPRRA